MKDSSPQLVYIMGTGHSGSTLPDVLLGTHSSAPLGEASNVAGDLNRRLPGDYFA